MPTQEERPALYLIEKIGACFGIEDSRKGQISGVEQDRGTWFNLKRQAVHPATAGKPGPSNGIMSIVVWGIIPETHSSLV